MAEPNKAFPNDSPDIPAANDENTHRYSSGSGLKVESSKKRHCAEIVLPMESHLALCKSNIQQKGRYEDLSRFHFDCISSLTFRAAAADLPVVSTVDWQPFSAQVSRLLKRWITSARRSRPRKKAIFGRCWKATILLEALRRCRRSSIAIASSVSRSIPEMRVKVAQGQAKPEWSNKAGESFWSDPKRFRHRL